MKMNKDKLIKNIKDIYFDFEKKEKSRMSYLLKKVSENKNTEELIKTYVRISKFNNELLINDILNEIDVYKK